jgi:hypothetical protein
MVPGQLALLLRMLGWQIGSAAQRESRDLAAELFCNSGLGTRGHIFTYICIA